MARIRPCTTLLSNSILLIMIECFFFSEHYKIKFVLLEVNDHHEDELLR